MGIDDLSWERHPKLSTGLIGLVLGAVVTAVYHPIVGHSFVNFDDPMYLYENGRVSAGLTADGWKWAWINKDVLQWHPLTWLGHMLVSQWGGSAPAPHLLVNAALHWCNAWLVFLWLRRATGSVGRSLAVAVLFAVHPINVETAAWASQLKSTLSTFFMLGALLAYTRYAQGGGWRAYGAAVLSTALGLMAKSMLVSLPLVLVLMDFWPLRRLPGQPAPALPAPWARLVWDKIPFVLLALAGAVVTSVPWGPHSDLHTVNGLQWERVITVPLNYARYLGHLVWPADLAVMYPERLGGPAGLLAGAALLLVAITAFVWRARERCPAVLFGWGWFLATLGPVSGIIRIGPHGLADRYLYVPVVGFLVAGVWLVADSPLGKHRRLPAVLLAAVAGLYGALAFTQVHYWRDSLTLWRHAAAVTPPSALGHLNLGNALLGAGRAAEAADEFNAAVRLDASDPRPYINLAVIAQQRGDGTEAVRLLRFALQITPDDARIHSNLGSLLQDKGDIAGAREHLERAIALRPDFSEAHTNLAVLLAAGGDLAGALPHFSEAVRLKPGDAAARQNLELAQRQVREQRP